MFARLAEASTSLDIGTLFVIATCVTTLLGLFLLFAWMQDRVQALAWWGLAYLIGGFSGVLWQLGDALSPWVPPWIADVLLLIALGMIWSAARLFHGRQVRWGAMCFGATVWAASCMSSVVPHSPAARIVLSSVIVATYTFLIAAELWRERRKSLIRRWPALFVPMLHGAIFLFPVALASLGVRSLATGWIAVFAIEVVLYVVGAAFIVLVLAKDRAVNRYKAAAETDPLTALLNRRGFFTAATALMSRQQIEQNPGQRARLRSRSLQVDQRPLRPQVRRCGVRPVRQGGPIEPARRRRRRPDRRRGICRRHLRHARRSLHCRRARAFGLRTRRRGAGQPANPGDRQYRRRLRHARRVDRRADRARRRRALSRQGEWPQSRRARREMVSSGAERLLDCRAQMKLGNDAVPVSTLTVPILVR